MSWLPKNKVIIPVDFCDESISAVGCAENFVEDASHLHIVHVLPDLSPNEPGVIWGTVDNKSRTEHALEALKKKFGGGVAAKATFAVRFGNAAGEIAKYADEVKADLVILPSHGRTGARHILLGSVAERVVRLCHCPVLVLRK